MAKFFNAGQICLSVDRHSGTDSGAASVTARRLLLGERLRRIRLTARACTSLRMALDTCDRLGAEPWSARAAAELAASGLTGRTCAIPADACDNAIARIVRTRRENDMTDIGAARVPVGCGSMSHMRRSPVS